MPAWKLETAKAKLSEVVRQAQTRGPQVITVRGAEAAVLVSWSDFAAFGGAEPAGSWVDRFRSAFTGDVDLEREQDSGRDLDI